MAFRDRFFTPQVARAIMSPLGILLAGAGAAAGILAGLPIAAAAAVGAVAYGARVAVAIPRPRRGPDVDPFALKEPWRHFVQDAQQARNRFEAAIRGTRPGPLQDRLKEIGERVATGVEEVWAVARQGHAFERALGHLDVRQTQAQLAQVERNMDEPWAHGTNLERTAQALRSQLASAERMYGTVQQAGETLQLLNAQLDEAVARAIELSVTANDVSDLETLGTDVDSVVQEMEALRQALEETEGPGRGLATGTA
ncbi:MAG TPA: hypothetical protein VGB14_06495 [Acidimicrobiales bacterium]|jgi:hypothetical protein